MSSEGEIKCTAPAAFAPKCTETAPAKPLPRIVTFTPPRLGPKLGVRPVSRGEDTKVKLSAGEVVEVPPAAVTATSTVPAASGGEVATQTVGEEQLATATTAPNATVVAPSVVENPVPVIVTGVPPAAGPAPGMIPATVGAAGAGPGPVPGETRAAHWA